MSWVYSVTAAWENFWNKAVVPVTNASPIAPTLDDIEITGIDRTPENQSIEDEKRRRFIISLAIAGVAIGGLILIATRSK